MRRFATFLVLACVVQPAAAQTPAFLLKKGDRVAWIGSSSTAIGVWPRTMEFLLRTRHPELELTFSRHSTGGGTFVTGLKNLDRWLEEARPTRVFLNYGGNDANAGEKGLPAFKDSVRQCVDRVERTKARVVLMTPQAADVRKSKPLPALRRMLYAQTLLGMGKDHGWDVIDVFTPLAKLQREQEKVDPSYTILRDTIHPTREAYIAWAYFLYQRVNPPAAASIVHLDAGGAPILLKNCKIDGLKRSETSLSFVRADAILPLVPPLPLPPEAHVPLLELSPYWLQITGLKPGNYEILVEGQSVGTASDQKLKGGVNLNELTMRSTQPAPWATLVEQIWNGKSLDQIGMTRWRFEIRFVSK